MRPVIIALMILLIPVLVHAQAAPTAMVQPVAVAEAVAVVQPVVDAVTPEKRALILKFIDVFGTRRALEQNFDLMLEQMPADKPEEAAQMRERIKVDEIIEQLIPVYDRNFSTEDLQGFIVFYDSPVGRKLLTTVPVLMKESVEVSAKYLESKFPEIKEELQK